MKKILTLGLLTLAVALQAQDTLFLSNEEIIECEVVSTSTKEIEYTQWKKENPVYNINVSLVDSIHYNTGEVEYFTTQSPSSGSNDQSDLDESNGTYLEGYSDGLVAPIGSVGTASFAGGFCCGLPGVVAPIVTVSNAEDKVPIEKRMSTKAYDRGYVAGVKKQVRRKAWTNYGVGFGAAVALVVITSL